MDNMIVKKYDYKSFKMIDKKNDKDYLEFLKESKKECFEDSWF